MPPRAPFARKALTSKQATAAKLITTRVRQGEPFNSDMLAAAHDEAYQLGGDRKKAQTYAGKNLSSAGFLASLHLDDDECQSELRNWLWMCLQGAHPMFPKDKELMIVSAKLLARASFVEKHEIRYDEGEFSTKSNEELRYYATHGQWPSEDQKVYHAEHGAWPPIIEGSSKPN